MRNVEIVEIGNTADDLREDITSSALIELLVGLSPQHTEKA
jgi:hypothetical protein